MNLQALVRCRTYRRPFDSLLLRYALGKGTYPANVGIRSTSRREAVTVHVRSHYDMLTVQEVFLWECYPCRGDEKVVLDLGANIGVSMLYFLSKAPRSHVVGVEPLRDNFTCATRNLRAWQERATLVNAAVLDDDGVVELGVEPSGRYSGLAQMDGQLQTFPCIGINRLVAETVRDHGPIDLLKIDVEGAERPIVAAMTPASFAAVRRIAIEGGDIPFDTLADAGYLHHRHPSGVHWFERNERDGRLPEASLKA